MPIPQNLKKYFCVLIILISSTSINHYFGQVTFTATLKSINVTHKTCNSNTSSLTFVYNVKNTTNPPTGGAYVCGVDYSISNGTSLTQSTASYFEIKSGKTIGGTIVTTFYPTTSNEVCVSSSGGYDITCTIDMTNINSLTGVYSIWPKIQVNNLRAGAGVRVLATTGLPNPNIFHLGYKNEFGDVVDAQKTNNSFVRNIQTVGQTYAGVNSINQLNNSNNGCIDVGAQFSSTVSTGSVYAVIGRISSISSFSTTPTSNNLFYVLFNKLSASTGTVSIITNTNTYLLTGVLFTDRILIERTNGNTVKFYKNNLNNLISGAPVLTNIAEWKVNGFTTGLNNGLLNVITSFPCALSTIMYAKLDRELTGVNYLADNKLNFVYDEEYSLGTSPKLSYRILNSKNQPVQCSGDLCNGTYPSAIVFLDKNLGLNRYELDISNLYSDQCYILEVQNDKKEKFYLRFTARTNNWGTIIIETENR
jgi:hypothetical protein